MLRMIALAVPLALSACVTAPTPTGDNWANFTQTTRAGPVLVQPLRLIEDSRCPADVLCVWQGQVVIEARLTLNGKASIEQLTMNDEFEIAGGHLTLDVTNPTSFTTDKPPQNSDYEFHFTYRPLR